MAERFKYRSGEISGFISYFQARLLETSNRSEDLSESLFCKVAPAKSLTTDAVVVKGRRLEPGCLRQAEKQASITTKTQWKTFPEYWNSWETKRKAGWTLTRNDTYLDDWVSHGSIFRHHRSVELTAEHGGVVVHIRDVYIHRGDGAEGGRASITSLHRQEVVSAGLIVQRLGN